jgi:hypothetical protein
MWQDTDFMNGRGRNVAWTKWWWLGYFGVQTWTVEEQRARMAMGFAVLGCGLAIIGVAGPILE